MAHKTDVSAWPKAPSAPVDFKGNEKDRDQFIQDFISSANSNLPDTNNGVFKKFVFAISSLLTDKFNASDPVKQRESVANDLANAKPTPGTRWEVYRDQARDFLLESKTQDPVKVAIVYQLENGLLREQAEEKTHGDALVNHIQKDLATNSGKTMKSDELVTGLIYLFRRGSATVYNQVMKAFQDAKNKVNGQPHPDLVAEWDLLNAFPVSRKLSTLAFYTQLGLLDQAVEKFYSAGTNPPGLVFASASAPASASVPVSSPAPASAPANNASSVSPIALAPVPLSPPVAAPTAKQAAIKATMDNKKVEMDQQLKDLVVLEAKIVEYQKLMAGIDSKTVDEAEKIRKRISAKAAFVPNSGPLLVMAAKLAENKNIEDTDPQAVAQQQTLQQIYDDAKKIYEDGKTGIKPRADAANAALKQLKYDSEKAVGEKTVFTLIYKMDKARANAEKESYGARLERDKATKESDEKVLRAHRLDIETILTTVNNEVTFFNKTMRELRTLEAANPAWWNPIGPTALTKATNMENEILARVPETEAYLKEVEALIAKAISPSSSASAPAAPVPAPPAPVPASAPYKAPPPVVDKFKDNRKDQCNVWYHMFDTARLDRSDAYRLAQLEAHPDQPWAINFESILDVIKVLEAAVKTTSPNNVMKLKDHANFYTKVEDLIKATCKELKMAPPQPNTLDEKMLLFVATGASLHDGVQWAYANDQITAWKFLRLTQIVNTRADPASKKIKIVDATGKLTDTNLFTQSRHVPTSQSAKPPKFVRIEEAY